MQTVKKRERLGVDLLWKLRDVPSAEIAARYGYHLRYVQQATTDNGFRRGRNAGRMLEAPCAKCRRKKAVEDLDNNRVCEGCQRGVVVQETAIDPAVLIFRAELPGYYERKAKREAPVREKLAAWRASRTPEVIDEMEEVALVYQMDIAS